MEKDDISEKPTSSSCPGEEKPIQSHPPSTDANASDNSNGSNAKSNDTSIDEKEGEEEKEKVKEEEGEKKEEDQQEEQEEEPDDTDFKSNFHKISEEIDHFISNAKNHQDPDGNPPPEVPNSVEKFAKMVEEELSQFDSSKEHGKWSHEFNEDSATLLQAIDKVVLLTEVLQRFASNPNYLPSIDRTTSLLQRAMAFLEDEFLALLEDCSEGGAAGSNSSAPATHDLKTKQPPFKSNSTPEADQSCTPENDSGDGEEDRFPGYQPEVLSRLSMIAKAMMSAGYESECCQAFTIVRFNLFEESLNKVGLERVTVEDVQKMNWESLEADIATWTKVCKLCISAYFSTEKNLCEAIFAGHPSVSNRLFTKLGRAVILQFLNFAAAVAMTKRSSERLFKFLDIYETLHELIKSMDNLIQGEPSLAELKTETTSARCRIGEAAVFIFSDLENSIKADNGKTPVASGAVHPLTRYLMNYLKYACEYNDTLEEVFQQHQKVDNSDPIQECENEGREEEKPASPFAVQLMAVMDLLDSNLEAKSKLYKDLSLSYIFLMNNGQYIMQKIRGSGGIHDLLGDPWRRKRSSDLRQYHKNYQRETWSKVLGCLKDEGLQQGKGSVAKPLLKERFKSFNAMVDEIHKTQSAWVVSDEQLQSELRVSIAAVIIPAYRSFLGRFQQYLDPGRQTEKYIKYGPEELEAAIDELFDGTPASMVKRR